MTKEDQEAFTWTEVPLEQALRLDAIEPGRLRNIPADINHNGRAYGGNSIALALLAASWEVPRERVPAALQLMFLRGVLPDEPVDYLVASLQDGKRFSARHVRATQKGQAVLDAHISFVYRTEEDAPAHTLAMPQKVNPPEGSCAVNDLPAKHLEVLRGLGAYSRGSKSYIDFRVPSPDQLLAPEGDNRFEFWVRARPPLPSGPQIDSVVTAYLTDWWLNYTSLSNHVGQLAIDDQELYVASLNHAVWFYEAHDPTEWLLFSCHSPRAGGGRGLSVANVYDRPGRLVAAATQECMMALRFPVS